MNNDLPTTKDIEELVAFSTILYDKNFTISKTPLNKINNDTLDIFQITDYNDVVLEFFELASKPCWSDYKYSSKNVSDMIGNKNLINNASLEKIITMLTYCVRGERFCDGFWASMIEDRYIKLLLERLIELNKK